MSAEADTYPQLVPISSHPHDRHHTHWLCGQPDCAGAHPTEDAAAQCIAARTGAYDHDRYRAEVVLTFHLFDVAWDDGATWTGYDTAHDAGSAAASLAGQRTGTVVERRFEERFLPGSTLLQLARQNGKAIAERWEVTPYTRSGSPSWSTNRSSSTPDQPKD